MMFGILSFVMMLFGILSFVMMLFGILSHSLKCKIRYNGIMSQMGLCRNWDDITIRIMSQLGLCRKWDYVAIGNILQLGLCCNWDYVRMLSQSVYSSSYRILSVQIKTVR